MFRKNNDHFQSSLLETTNTFNKKIVEKLNRSWATIFYEEVFCKIDEGLFRDFFSEETGRPNFPVNILLGLHYIKEMFDYTDEELLEQFNFNLLVSYSLGIRCLGSCDINRSTFYEFRKKLYSVKEKKTELIDIIDRQFKIHFNNFVKRSEIDTSLQRIDSTSVMSNIAKFGRTALAYDVLRSALTVIPVEILPEKLLEASTSDFKKSVLYRVKPSDKSSKFELLINLGVMLLAITQNDDVLSNLNEVKILKRFIQEQTKIENEKVTIKKPEEIPSSSLQSAFDEDATFRSKAGKKESGYVLNIAETCNKSNEIQLVSDYSLEKNNKSDVEILKERLPEIKNTGCNTGYVDGAYYSKDIGIEEGIKVNYTDMTGKALNPEKISILEFEFDKDDSHIIACPAGFLPTSSGVKINKNKDIVYSARFDLNTCEKCEFKDNCPINFNKKSTSININERSYKAAKTRLEIKMNKEENSSFRVAIEGTNSELKRKHGLGKLKIRGIIKSRLVSAIKVAACNIKRFIKYARNNKQKLGEYNVSTS